MRPVSAERQGYSSFSTPLWQECITLGSLNIKSSNTLKSLIFSVSLSLFLSFYSASLLKSWTVLRIMYYSLVFRFLLSRVTNFIVNDLRVSRNRPSNITNLCWNIYLNAVNISQMLLIWYLTKTSRRLAANNFERYQELIITQFN